jgi:cytochrome b6-f complex iron-sulfur subunit
MIDPKQTNSRRSFLRQAAASVGLVLSAPAIVSIVASCETDEITGPTGKQFIVDITQYPELAVVGGITVITITGLNNGNPVFISRIEQDRFAVFTTVCTHQGCQVGSPESSGANCICPCHGAEYSSADGKVLGQPFGGSATDLPSFGSTFNASTSELTING